jgi:drug/metabolite transporter (DMT)-like permease
MSRGNIGRLALLALLWGSSFLWIKLALRGLDPVQIVLVRLALGAAVLIPIALSRRQRLPRDPRMWGHLAFAALTANAVPYVLFGIGEKTTGSTVAGMLNATTPLWTALVGLAVGTDRDLGVRRGLGLALGLAGTVLIFSPWHAGTAGIASRGGVACLAAAVSYGISYTYIGRYLTGRGIPPLMLSAAQLTAATGWLVLALPIAGRDPVHWRADTTVAVVVLGVFGTGFAYMLNYRLIADEGPAAASAVTYLLPVVATALGALVLNESVTLLMVAGMLLILAGVALTQRRRTRTVAAEDVVTG